MNFVLGQLFGLAAQQITAQAGLKMSDIAFIASHGQTVYHIPRGQDMTRSTLQIGEAAVIAEMTGCLTISDFRTRDIAAGGDGAPLVPYMEYLLFQQEGIRRVMVNIGGISNLTVLDPNLDNVIAFDTGPGNALIDEVARRIGEGIPYDVNGKLASEGTVHQQLLEELMTHPYFKKPPPKSTGRELFGVAFLQRFERSHPQIDGKDLLATLTAFTARALHDSLQQFVFPWTKVDELVFSGGGVHNKTLMGFIRDHLPAVAIRTTNEFGIDVDAKEAIAFAVLGNETLMGAPGNVPRATGAGRQVILGKVSLP
jgi:anhydro-N-acetylmuramic acid kinase